MASAPPTRKTLKTPSLIPGIEALLNKLIKGGSLALGSGQPSDRDSCEIPFAGDAIEPEGTSDGGTLKP
jgi:hypothetical protein